VIAQLKAAFSLINYKQTIVCKCDALDRILYRNLMCGLVYQMFFILASHLGVLIQEVRLSKSRLPNIYGRDLPYCAFICGLFLYSLQSWK